jgi:hypothetical protein
MLRLIVLLLLLLNAGYYAWSHGGLQALGLAPLQQGEPQRLAQQLKPEALRRLSAEELRLAETPPPPPRVVVKPPVCLKAGLFNENQSALLRRTLSHSWPTGAWSLEAAAEPARWIVYMGKYANAAELAKKRAQLDSLDLTFEPLTNPALGLGLSLGGFGTQAAAQAALATFSRRGVHTARVVQEHAEVRGTLLRLPAVDEALRARLDELKPVLAGKGWRPC